MVKKGKPEKKVMKHEEIRVMKEEAKKKEEQIAKERETVKAEVSKDDHKKVRQSSPPWSLLRVAQRFLFVSAPEHSCLTLIPTQKLYFRHD